MKNKIALSLFLILIGFFSTGNAKVGVDGFPFVQITYEVDPNKPLPQTKKEVLDDASKIAKEFLIEYCKNRDFPFQQSFVDETMADYKSLIEKLPSAAEIKRTYTTFGYRTVLMRRGADFSQRQVRNDHKKLTAESAILKNQVELLLKAQKDFSLGDQSSKRGKSLLSPTSPKSFFELLSIISFFLSLFGLAVLFINK